MNQFDPALSRLGFPTCMDPCTDPPLPLSTSPSRFHLKYLVPSGTLRASEMQPPAEGKTIICIVSLFGWTTKNFILEVGGR